MSILKHVRKFLYQRIENCYALGLYKGELKNIRRKEKFWKSIELTKEQKQEIDQFYLINYGKKISYKWHRLYTSYTGRFDPQYFPEILFTTKMEPILNPRNYAEVLSDKSFVPMLIEDVEEVTAPATILNCIRGDIWYQHKIIDIDQAVQVLFNIGEVILKPTVDSCSGHNVLLCDFHDGTDRNTRKSVKEILSCYRQNFIVQTVIKEDENWAALHPNSLNTMRITTYICPGKDEIQVAPLLLRMGRNNSFLDNAHAGGIVIAVSDDGVLDDTAYSEYQEKYQAHPDSKITFSGYQLPYVEKIVTAAKRLHERIPQLKILSWDLCPDEEGKIVLVECNTLGQGVWFPQYFHGKGFFEDNTASMLQIIRKR